MENMSLTEQQKSAVKEYQTAVIELQAAQQKLAQFTQALQRRNEELQRAFSGLNGKKVLVRLPRRAPVLVSRAPMKGEVIIEPLAVAC